MSYSGWLRQWETEFILPGKALQDIFGHDCLYHQSFLQVLGQWLTNPEYCFVCVTSDKALICSLKCHIKAIHSIVKLFSFNSHFVNIWRTICIIFHVISCYCSSELASRVFKVEQWMCKKWWLLRLKLFCKSCKLCRSFVWLKD